MDIGQWITRFNSKPTPQRSALPGDFNSIDKQILIELGRQLFLLNPPVQVEPGKMDDKWCEYAGLKTLNTLHAAFEAKTRPAKEEQDEDMMYVVFWDEYEAGRTAPDGCTLHRTAEAARHFILKQQRKWLSAAREGSTTKSMVRSGPALVKVSPRMVQWCTENFDQNESHLWIGVNESYELLELDPYAAGWTKTNKE